MNYKLRNIIVGNIISIFHSLIQACAVDTPKICILAGQSEVTSNVATAEQKIIMDTSQEDDEATKAEHNETDRDTPPGERRHSTSETSTDTPQESPGGHTSTTWPESRSSLSIDIIQGTPEEHHKFADGKSGFERATSKDEKHTVPLEQLSDEQPVSQEQIEVVTPPRTSPQSAESLEIATISENKAVRSPKRLSTSPNRLVSSQKKLRNTDISEGAARAGSFTDISSDTSLATLAVIDTSCTVTSTATQTDIRTCTAVTQSYLEAWWEDCHSYFEICNDATQTYVNSCTAVTQTYPETYCTVPESSHQTRSAVCQTYHDTISAATQTYHENYSPATQDCSKTCGAVSGACLDYYNVGTQTDSNTYSVSTQTSSEVATDPHIVTDSSTQASSPVNNPSSFSTSYTTPCSSTSSGTITDASAGFASEGSENSYDSRRSDDKDESRGNSESNGQSSSEGEKGREDDGKSGNDGGSEAKNESERSDPSDEGSESEDGGESGDDGESKGLSESGSKEETEATKEVTSESELTDDVKRKAIVRTLGRAEARRKRKAKQKWTKE